MVQSNLIQASMSDMTGAFLYTFQWDYPRFIHAEIMTHRVFSRNAGSSRAIPVMTAVDLARDHMVVPSFKKNKPGMQPGDMLSAEDLDKAQSIWRNCAQNCIEAAQELNDLKVHKQWANRMLEWFSPIRIVVTATEWDNFLWLRNDFEAQDEIALLAEQVEQQLRDATPFVVPFNHAHVPYVDRRYNNYGEVMYSVDGVELTINDALMVSASVCGQMSYRKADTSLKKARDLFERFMESRRVHASPTEHQAIASHEAMTHSTFDGAQWSANFRGWSQFRHMIANNTCRDLQVARMKEAGGLL